jgi:hypothetical protein
MRESRNSRSKTMEPSTVGRVLTEAAIENLEDLHLVNRGMLPPDPDQVRRVTVSDALVDTGATLLSLPTWLIKQLGLRKQYSKRVTNTSGIREVDVYGTA